MKILETIDSWSLGRKELDEEARAYVDSPFEFLTKEIFESCPFKDYIFRNQEVLFILTIGSSLNKLVDNYSDYDLVVITKEHFESHENYRISYNGRNIHWYYRTIEEIYNVDNHLAEFLRLAGLFQYKFLTEDNLLYLNSNYLKEWQVFLKHANTLAELGLNLSYKLAKTYINTFFETKTPSKCYHKIANIYYNITNTEPDYEFLLRVKRVNRQPISKEDEAKLADIFTKFLQLIPPEEQIAATISALKHILSLAWKRHIGAIFVHFPENGHHGCGKHCPFCLFDQVDYNIPILPTDEEIINFMSNIIEDGKVQICGAGDPLYNFEKHKDYITHIVDLIHQYGYPVEIVTKYVEVVDQYVDTDLKNVDGFLFSVETLNENIFATIDKVTQLGKYVRISKIANFTEDIYELDWEFLEKYAAFYSKITHKDHLKICYRPNYNYNYRDKDVQAVQESIHNWEEKYGCRIYMHAQSSHILMPQLWNGRWIPCSETHKYIYSDMGLENPEEK